MKKSGNTAQVIGIILIIMQILGYWNGGEGLHVRYDSGLMMMNVSTFIGSNFFAILGLIFLFISYKRKKSYKDTKNK
jgi:hypothetical protein